MKNLFSLFLLFLSIAACRKDNVFNEHGLYGGGSAKLNGVAWTGKAGVFFTDVFCAPDSCIAISLFHYNESDALRGKITLNHVPLRTGRQTLNYTWPLSKDVLCALSYSVFTSDGDVITGDYSVFEQNDDNYLNITKLDLNTGLISGTFQATVVRDSFWTFPGYQPDTIRITEGTFSGKIFE
ncbi:MAG: hypothetical protein IT223_04020, partial [Crocinitomicaceae bacterium]|nr:hypothetical protein [Crocinitomicaceae bacterium]